MPAVIPAPGPPPAGPRPRVGVVIGMPPGRGAGPEGRVGWLEDRLAAAARAGADSVRIPVGWSQCEPRDGVVDREALTWCATVAETCAAHALAPEVVLSHRDVPAWLRPGFWLRPEAPDRYAAWVGAVADALGEVVGHWTTVDRVGHGALPRVLDPVDAIPVRDRCGRAVPAPANRALDAALVAHVHAYAAVRARSPGATITHSTTASSLYEGDALLRDVLLAPLAGVPRREVGAWVRERREQYYARIDAGEEAPLVERLLRARAARRVPLAAALPRAVAAAHRSEHVCTLDEDQLAVFEPWAHRLCRVPGRRDGRRAGARRWTPRAAVWEWAPDPDASARVVAATAAAGAGRPVRVSSSGMATPGPAPRPDGLDRATFLGEQARALTGLLRRGVPVAGYVACALTDEGAARQDGGRWGLYGTGPGDGRTALLPTDATGIDAAGALRDLARSLAEATAGGGGAPAATGPGGGARG